MTKHCDQWARILLDISIPHLAYQICRYQTYLQAKRKKLAWWIPVVSGFTALVLGVALGWGFTQMHAEHTLKEVVAAKDVEIERLDTSLNSVKAQLEAALGRDAGQGAGGDSGTSGDTEGRPNEEISNGGITMKLLESGRSRLSALIPAGTDAVMASLPQKSGCRY